MQRRCGAALIARLMSKALSKGLLERHARATVVAAVWTPSSHIATVVNCKKNCTTNRATALIAGLIETEWKELSLTSLTNSGQKGPGRERNMSKLTGLSRSPSGSSEGL